MGHCCCGAHSCTTENKKNASTSIVHEYWKVGLSFILLIGGIIMNALNFAFFLGEYVALIWYILAYLPVGIPVMKEAWEGIREKDYFSEFTLMIVATLGAFYIGEYPEGVAVMLFYTIGELFQNKAVDRAKRNIGALLDVRPEKALVLREDNLVVESPQNVKVGEVIEIKAGGRVPLDGVMLNEIAAFNTAALTGESVPRDIRKGEEVLAGMIVTDKVIRIKVERPFDKSALARILELVQNASERKAPAELFIRKFARIYTPIVIALAVLIVLLPFGYSLIDPQFVFTFNDWLYRALVFLVISCPCALVVSIPLGYFGGIGAASRLGILFKGGNYLDAVTKINTVVFDKTGTLTKGTFEVQDCKCVSGISEKELVRMIASVESDSTHPIAKAIVNYAKLQDIGLAVVTNTKEFAGLGLEAIIDGTSVLVGNSRLLSKFSIKYPTELQSVTDTIVVCAIGGSYAGYLLLADALKDDAKTAIDNLKALNIENIQILCIIDEVYKEAGQAVRKGEVIAKVKVIPELGQLNSAESRVRLAEINATQAETDFSRVKKLYEDQLISREEYEKSEVALKQAREERQSAKDNLEIVKEGITKNSASFSSTMIRSTIDGLILDVPVKAGNSVIMSNTFNDGTTIATVANMNDMIFRGNIDETEVGRIHEQMPIKLTIGALQNLTFNAILEYISPKGVETNGANQFEIKAAITIPDSVQIRSGYSANAEIVLQKANQVLAVPESTVEFSGDSTFVYIMTDSVPEQKFQRTQVTAGMSDGIKIEIKKGVTIQDKIRGAEKKDK